MNKNKTEIMVKTQAEGYVLEVGQKGYLYDSEGQLVEGLIYHVLLNGKSHRRGREVSKLLRTFTDKTKVELQREVVALKERCSRNRQKDETLFVTSSGWLKRSVKKHKIFVSANRGMGRIRSARELRRQATELTELLMAAQDAELIDKV